MKKLIDISYFIKNENFQNDKELCLNKNYSNLKSNNYFIQDTNDNNLQNPLPKISYTPSRKKSNIINYNDNFNNMNNLCIKRESLENSLPKTRNIENKIIQHQNKSYTTNEIKNNRKNKVFFPLLKSNNNIKENNDKNSSVILKTNNNNVENILTKGKNDYEKNEEIIDKYMNILSIKPVKPIIKNIPKINNIKFPDKKNEEKISIYNSKIKFGKMFNANRVINNNKFIYKNRYHLHEKNLRININILNTSKSVKTLKEIIKNTKKQIKQLKLNFPPIIHEQATPQKNTNKINKEKEEKKNLKLNINENNKNNYINIIKKDIIKKKDLIRSQENENFQKKIQKEIKETTVPKRLKKIIINQNKIEKPKKTKFEKIDNFLKPYQSLDKVNIKYLSKKEIPYKINLYTNIYCPIEIYYYTVNKMYIRQLPDYMDHRVNWELIDTKLTPEEEKTININFQWKYFSDRLNFKKYKYDPNIRTPNKKYCMVNLFERNYEIGNKRNMFKNLISYCDKVNLNVFDFVPFTMSVSYSKDIDLFLQALKEIMNFINTNKKNENKNLISTKKYNEHFWFDKNYNFLQNQYINFNKNFLSDKNYWIIKPPDLYQGKCIQISDNFDEINKLIKNMFKGVDKRLESDSEANSEEDESNEDDQKISSNLYISKSEINLINGLNINTETKKKKKKIYSKITCFNDVIIQKYLDNPLLYKKRKFDIRCYVLVDGNLNVFFCREGHLKASSELYDINTTNKFIHITNHSLQKKSSKFEQYEYGNEMSYSDLKKFMEEENIPLSKFEKMIEDMKMLVKISFKSVGNKLLKVYPVFCFEIFGYDFILDNDFRPWILEINNNPGLGISSPVIEKLVPRMFDDALRLTIDKVFETKYSEECIDIDGKYKSKYKLEGFDDDENLFEFMCNVND